MVPTSWRTTALGQRGFRDDVQAVAALGHSGWCPGLSLPISSTASQRWHARSFPIPDVLGHTSRASTHQPCMTLFRRLSIASLCFLLSVCSKSSKSTGNPDGAYMPGSDSSDGVGGPTANSPDDGSASTG